MFFSNLKKRKLLIFSLIALLVILPVSYLVLENRSSVEAAWMNDNWGFRKAIAIPSHSTLETNVYVTVPTFDATDTSKFQADCGDLRFTKQNGEQLPYFVVDCDATANIHVQFDSLPAGASTYYMYYGNPSVQNGFSSADFSTAATGLGTQTLANEEKSLAPIAYWKLDEGYGNPNDSGSNAFNATSNSGTWLSEDQCVSGKCLSYIHGQTTTVPYNSKLNITSNVTLNVWAKVTQQNSSVWPILFGRSNPHIGYGIRQTKSSNRIYFEWGEGNTICDGASGNYTSLDFTTSGVDSQWHMYTMTQDGTTIKLYLDGKLVNSTSTNATFCSDASSTFLLGGNIYGSIDNGKVYNYVRTDAQIKSDFASKGGGVIKGTSVQMGTNAKNSDALSNGLVGYWKMDEASWTVDCTTGSVLDVSGNGNNASACPNSTGPTGGTVGKFGNGGLFDGSNDYVSIGGSTVYATKNAPFSASAWANLTDFSTSDYPVLVRLLSDDTQPWFIILSNQANYLGIAIGNSGSFKTIKTDIPTANLTGAWHHITATYNGKDSTDINNFNIYLDGQLQVNSAAGTFSSFAQASSISYGGSGNRWYGSIDEVRVYNRMITPAEVLQLYKWAPGPLIDINFDDNVGSTYYDKSGNNHNAPVEDLATIAACNNFLMRSPTLDTWTKIHDSIVTGTALVRNFAKTVTYTIGIDYDIDYPNGSIKLLSGGAMAINTYYYTDSTCTNAGPKLVIGKYGKALQFDGADDSLRINSATDITTNNNTRTTIMTWVYIDQDFNELGGSSNGQGIFGQNFFNPRLQYYNSRFETTMQFTDQNRNVTTSAIYPKNQWYHVATTWDGAYAKTYINGNLAATSVNWSAFSVSSAQNNWYIGRSQSGAGRGILNGKLDEIKYYNYARTSGQIIEDMNGGHPLGGSPVGSQVGYWKFDEGYGITANNSGSGGTTLNGTITGTPWTNNGKINKALQLNGSSNYISIPDNSSINPTTSFTVSTWIKPTILANNTNYNIFAKENWGAFLGYRLFLGGYGGCVDKNCLTGSVSNGTTRVSTPSTLYLTDINSWHHVTLVYSSTTLKMYLDGVLKSTTDSTTVSTISNTPLAASIGRHSSGGEFFPGVIDEVKYYSAALTADEIKLDYNRGSAMVLGTMSDTSGLSGGSIASSSASSAYCVPGDSVSCSPPVGEWNFEEASYTNNCSTATVFDTSTNGLNLLSCPNGTGPTSKVVGKKGSAAYLDGVNDELNSTSTNLDLTGEITTQAWVKITDVTNASDPEILNKSNNNAGYALEIGFSSRNPKFRIGNGTAYSVLSGTSVLQNNVWYFITGTLSSGGVQKIYVNGRQENSTTITGSLAAAVGQTFRLGVRGAGTYLNGAIDEAKIYNYARTPAQIAWDFNKGKPIGWWKLDECQGTTINDSSGNGYSGTLTIGATGTNTSAGTCTGSAGEAWKDGQIGRYNSGLDVDGTDDNGSIAGLSSFSFNSFTTSAWVKPSSGATSRIFSQQSGATVWLMGVSGSQLSYNGSDDGGLITMGPDIVSDGQWHHVAITRDTTNTLITFYVDGKNVGTTASGPNSYVIAAALSLFRHAGSDTQYYTGQVDDLRIYNYPLTSTQIKQVYNNGAISFAPATGSP